MPKTIEKQYIYLIQSSEDTMWCQIGKTKDLEQTLNEYNNTTDETKKNKYKYLFTCRVVNMIVVEYDFKVEFEIYRPAESEILYFYNPELLKKYVEFIRYHRFYIKEIKLEQV